MSTTARLFIDAAPEIGEQGFKYTIDCKWSTPRLWFAPGPIDLPERHRVSIALTRHAEECQRCNLARLWRDHGDLELKALTDDAWEQVQQRMVARHLAGRRN
jgi:hypothetical protein